MNATIKYKWPGLFFLWATYQLGEAFMHFHNDLFAFLLLMGVVPVLAHFIARRQGLAGLESYNLQWNANAKNLLTTGLLSGVITYTLSFIISWSTGREVITAHLQPGIGPVINTMLCVAGTFLPSIAEDIITRGYLYTVAGSKWNRVIFLVISSLVYVLNHTYKLAAPGESLLYLFITGVALAIPLVLTKSLWFTVGLHWACNIVYRVTNDVLQSTSVGAYHLSSFRILMITVLISIPINIYVINRNRNTIKTDKNL
ncbi:MAG: CPBP family intramembrane metalloprotease [Bacteroidetes bacterium]|nr:CPBP family intramembrane metalloprotease [Bacteroidota bacterium]